MLRTRASRRLFAGLLAGTVLLSQPARSAPLESAVKAAYLYKLAAFVTWPPTAFATPSSPFRICTMNRDDVARPLSHIVSGQEAWGRPIVVARVSATQGSSLSQCQILFTDGRAPIGDSAPVLTVSDRGSGAQQGVVEFMTEGTHVRFVVHRGQAEARRLQISSKLLAVAAAVMP